MFVDPQVYRAVVIKHGLIMWVRHKMKPNRGYTPSAMMRAASQITARTFRPSDYTGAIEALNHYLTENQS